jgi:hypothetical protein
MTLGPAVGAIATALGKPPMPHQQYIWDVALEIDPKTGYFAYSNVTLVGPRQVTGKTEQILPLMIHRCTGVGRDLVDFAMREYGLRVQEPGAQRVFFTAQTADAARTRWRDVHVQRIKQSPMRRMWSQSPRLTQNKESMFWINGSSWVPGATTGATGGTGDTLDLGVVDEAWSRPDNRTELSMRPAMMTRPWSQLWALSMVPGPSRVPPDGWPWLMRRMKAGRQRVLADIRRGTMYIEFSAADKIDEVNVADPDTWWSCMPGLGFTVPEQRVQDDYDEIGSEGAELGTLEDFAAEYLGIWPTEQLAQWKLITKPTWQGLQTSDAELTGPIALGVDANPNLTTASISMAGQLEEGGDVYVELVDRRKGVNWLTGAVLALARARPVCAVGVDNNGPLAGWVEPLTRAAIEENIDLTIVALPAQKVSAACSAFYNLTGEQDDPDPEGLPTTRRVRHGGQPELDQSVGGAIPRRSGDRWRYDRDESTADTGPVYAATFAVAAGDDQEWLGGAYDVMESLG